jgi:hypothetical protein
VKIRFLSVARRELDDAFTWYEGQAAGLGYEFLDEMDRVVRRIKAYPDSRLGAGAYFVLLDMGSGQVRLKSIVK